MLSQPNTSRYRYHGRFCRSVLIVLGLQFLTTWLHSQTTSPSTDWLPEVKRPTNENATTQNTQPSSLPTTPRRWRPSHYWVERCVQNATKYARNKPFQVQWVDYSLGDCVKMCHKCRRSVRASPIKRWSFAGYYLRNACNGTNAQNKTLGNNFTYLKEMFREFRNDTSFLTPTEEELVVHLRLGDVMERSSAPVVEMLYNGAAPYHPATAFSSFKSIKNISQFLDDIEQSGLTKVHIRGGSHYPEYYHKSRVYASCLWKAIVKSGYSVQMSIEKDYTPDQDFYFMAHAKYISLSTGSYSRLIGQMVRELGGTVLGRSLV